jgi:hypothetical protein
VPESNLIFIQTIPENEIPADITVFYGAFHRFWLN